MRKNVIRIISLLIASCVSVGLIGITAWATGTAGSAAPEPKYEKPDTNQLTNLGQEPEEISVSSKEKYFGKAWYEYIAYSDRAVSSIRISVMVGSRPSSRKYCWQKAISSVSMARP